MTYVIVDCKGLFFYSWKYLQKNLIMSCKSSCKQIESLKELCYTNWIP